MKKVIFGVKIDDVNMDEAVSKVHVWLQGKAKKYIVTPNPEFIMTAQDDPEFKKILNKADLSIPDGVGLKLSGRIKNTIPGTDLMERLIALAAEKGFVVGLLGGMNGVAEQAAERLQKKYPRLKIDSSSPDLLFVAFGHPKQEKWIAKNLSRFPVKVAMGVGGAFDYISGQVPRAPIRLRRIGLEWLFRLLLQPWRIKRQLKLLTFVWFCVKLKLYGNNS